MATIGTRPAMNNSQPDFEKGLNFFLNLLRVQEEQRLIERREREARERAEKDEADEAASGSDKGKGKETMSEEESRAADLAAATSKREVRVDPNESRHRVERRTISDGGAQMEIIRFIIMSADKSEKETRTFNLFDGSRRLTQVAGGSGAERELRDDNGRSRPLTDEEEVDEAVMRGFTDALLKAFLRAPIAARPPPSPRLGTPSETSLHQIYPQKHYCAVCQEQINEKEIRLECGHYYDIGCLKEMFSANVDDEHRFPPRCCGYIVPVNHVADDIPSETRNLYEEKMVEYKTAFRLYCSNITCNTFLGSRRERAETVTCPSCSTETCGKCTNAAHPRNRRCRMDKGLRRALKMGQQAGWQRCPTCRALVERDFGCYHMSCRCGTQFCYLCAEDWRHCACSNRSPVLILRLMMKKLRLRGNYLVDGEMPRSGAGPIANTCKKTWKGVVSAAKSVKVPFRRSA